MRDLVTDGWRGEWRWVLVGNGWDAGMARSLDMEEAWRHGGSMEHGATKLVSSLLHQDLPEGRRALALAR